MPRALIFEESFLNAMLPSVAEHFRQSHYVWEHWGNYTQVSTLVEKYKPNIIIELSVERYVDTDFALFSKNISSYLLE